MASHSQSSLSHDTSSGHVFTRLTWAWCALSLALLVAAGVAGCPPPVQPCCTKEAPLGSEGSQRREGLPQEPTRRDVRDAGAPTPPEKPTPREAPEAPPESLPDANSEDPGPEKSADTADEWPEQLSFEQPPVPESSTQEARCPTGAQAAPEVCDGKDNDCDGQIDEDLVGCVGTLAGTGQPGAANGRGIKASFTSPSALAVGPKGHLWIADTENHVIRKLDRSTNQVTTFAGTGQAGTRDGAAQQAQFHKPGGLTIAPNGDILVADTVNHRIRKITSAGVVSTIAGSDPGLRDGVGPNARFYFPSGVALNKYGEIFVADTLNHCIRKINKQRKVTTFAGNCNRGFANGRGAAAKFYFPFSLSFNQQGLLFVADGSNNMIRKIDETGEVSILAGEGQRGFRDGAARVARFYYPPGVTAAADGFVYVADASNQRIRRIAPDGTVTTLAGTGQSGTRDGPVNQARFFGPTGIVAAHNRLYIADFNSHSIRMIRLR